MCVNQLGGRCRLEIIDVIAHPNAACEARIIVTPTLVRMLPGPLRSIIGDLANAEKVLRGLGVTAKNPCVGGTAGPSAAG